MIPIGTKPMTIDQIRDVLKTHWGYDGFLPLQQEAMQCVLDDRDSVVVLPTGGGKSLCFQAPAVVRPGVGLVVSPLISLMKDQVDGLKAAGVAAACLNSSMDPAERGEVFEDLRAGELDLLYVAPERLVQSNMLDTFVQCSFHLGNDIERGSPNWHTFLRLNTEFTSPFVANTALVDLYLICQRTR